MGKQPVGQREGWGVQGEGVNEAGERSKRVGKTPVTVDDEWGKRIPL